MTKHPIAISELPTLSDVRLAELARDGSSAAFEAIVVRHRQGLVRHCARIVGDGDAEEAVQEALTRANSALIRGQRVRALAAWLRMIAHHVALDLLRAQTRRPSCADSAGEHPLRPDQSLEQRQHLRDVIAAVRALPPRQREAIVMLALEGRSNNEIATRLRTTPHAVSQLLNRARQSLHDHLAEPHLR